ncbi:unnamed protein product [Clonostachys chloroleuca]|uniref:Uncharacterized protein n=1 Tax=Clonostachys chloroleuca TaxID=1926264 RepID=A0AA35LY96_9HYPO|nr:unnamed protein product [Clonostachys chloroleuca]
MTPKSLVPAWGSNGGPVRILDLGGLEAGMRDCLVECHRLLVPSGRLEYIFFQDGLMKAGSLTTDIEHFLEEV